MKFSEILRKRRKAFGMTQVELAKSIGINDRTIQKYETGKSLPNAERALKLAQVLCLDVEVLLGYKERDKNKEKEKLLSDIINFFNNPNISEELKSRVYYKALEIYYLSTQKARIKS